MSPRPSHKILFASSEIYPLIKTGGLADVAQSLPNALQDLDQKVVLLLPAYGSAKSQLASLTTLVQFSIQGEEVAILQSKLPGTDILLWLVDCPVFFEREGNPYLAADGNPWYDNAQRFGLFSRVIALIAADQCGLNWRPDILHCNDWQTALAPALLHQKANRPGIIFTIHNLAYQGIFSYEDFVQLQLPAQMWSFDALEYHEQLSFIKGGIVYADQVNTVSPSYALEIQTEEYGFGLDPLLRHCQDKLSGIVNGIDLQEWSPSGDQFIPHAFSESELKNKAKNKVALQKALGLPDNKKTPMLSTISRLVTQKGIDLIVDVMEMLRDFDVQIVILGSGEKQFEQQLIAEASLRPDHVSVTIGYDEALAHRITAAADFFMMPSRFEPCGLNQMYSQRYGTIPIVRATGGLKDTVVDEEDGAGNTGIVFAEDDSKVLFEAVLRGLHLYADKKRWKKIQRNAMKKDFSWKNSAKQYLALYEKALR